MRVAEFFAGIGLVRKALEDNGMTVVWANDNDAKKLSMYEKNFDATDFCLRDVCDVCGDEIPDIDLATASFPCTDLSLAGNRVGLHGKQSSTFWEFTRIIEEMAERRPSAILLENVPSLATSRGGQDLYIIVRCLNQLGYTCDLLVVDARYFVPQSRPRLFVVGSREPLSSPGTWAPSTIRPSWVQQFVSRYPDLQMNALDMSIEQTISPSLNNVVERLNPADIRWWDQRRYERFVAELSEVQTLRLRSMELSPWPTWATAYRRTRNGKPAWEIRSDSISGCLRTARGGSSKQAVVEARDGVSRVRWMTAVEYAQLQGAGDYNLTGVLENQALFGFGDAVCVPAVAWVAREYLVPLLNLEITVRKEAPLEELSLV
ncbi:MAG: DNA (cytosine-5-)-methyltransferase [Chloroflexia bacterium]|jgi:DNA (cytosine-5)-methyltransferase 1|nr:DNA (cytosine-5-)-methyltransferase [Chloroflexia bacterium]